MIAAALAVAAALAAHAAPRASTPAKRAEPPGPGSGPPALRLSAEPKTPLPGERLAAFGIEVTPVTGGLRVDHVLTGSDAEGLGLKPGDLLLDVGGIEASFPISVAQALDRLKPETRLWAVVRRGESAVVLETELPKLRLAPPRGVESLSPLETELARQHVETAGKKREQAVKSLTTPRLDIGSGLRTWVHFPAGLPAELKAGDVVEGLVSTGLAADASLDYLAIGPGSQVWAEVVSASTQDGVRLLRLHVFKLRLRGGHTYPVSARVVDLTGDRTLTQLSPGGTIVTADASGLGPDLRVQIELLKGVTLYEPPSYYRAGVGLWLKQRGGASERVLEVSHVIPGRAAEKAGIQVGDVLVHVGGKAAAKLEFLEGLDRLYGAPGTTVSVRVQRGDKIVSGMMELERGVRYGPGKGNERKDEKIPVPPPFKT